jgi:antitoxin component YwqK of YwqJK toxin-antitoxin module
MKNGIKWFAPVLGLCLYATAVMAEPNPVCPEGTTQIGYSPSEDTECDPHESTTCDIEFWCEDSNGLKQGPYRKWQARYNNRVYLALRGHFKNSQPDGLWVAYQENGTGDYNVMYQNGVMRSSTYFNDRGRIVRVKTYDEEGREDGEEKTGEGKVLCRWSHGQKRGLCHEGRESFTYDDKGKANGPCTVYCNVDHGEGSDFCRGTCVDGKLNGDADVYNEEYDTEPSIRGPFKEGLMDGCYWEFKWFGNERGCMKQGKRDGDWRECNDSGQCETVTYKEDVEVGRRQIDSPAPPAPPY